MNQQAIAAIENALLDIKGKDLGVPVCALFGGPVRERIPVYWSHTGTYRVRNAALMGVQPLHSLRRSRRALRGDPQGRGFKALKTNILPFDGRTLYSSRPVSAARPAGRS